MTLAAIRHYLDRRAEPTYIEVMCPSIEKDASRIESLIETVQLSKALWLLRDALARNPRDLLLLGLAAKLAAAAESRAMDLACNKATDGSPRAQEAEAIAKQAREYLTC